MTISKYILKNIITKQNILLIITLPITLIIIFISLSLIKHQKEIEYFINNNYTPNLIYNVDIFEKNLNGRDLSYEDFLKYYYTDYEPIIDTDRYKELNNNPNIKKVMPSYYNQIRTTLLKNTTNSNRYITIKTLIDNDSIKLTNGSYPNKGEIICPNNLYSMDSDSSNTIFNLQKIDKNRIVNVKDIIGEKLIVESHYDFTLKNNNPTFKSEDIAFTISGTYNNNYSFDNMSTCYISTDSLPMFKDYQCLGHETEYDENDNPQLYCYHYKGRSILFDNAKDATYEIEKLKEEGYEIDNINQKFIIEDNNTKLPYLICRIVIILLFVITILLLNKKFKYNNKKIGLLKSYGYKTTNIIIIEILDNFITITLSNIIGILLYILLLKVFDNSLLYNYKYSGMSLSIDTTNIIILYAILIIVSIVYTIIKSIMLSKKVIINVIGE